MAILYQVFALFVFNGGLSISHNRTAKPCGAPAQTTLKGLSSSEP